MSVSASDKQSIMSKLDKGAMSVVKLLYQNGLKISVAESCTGGMLSQYITSVSGASSVLEYGICSYSERIKNKELGVSLEDIARYGVVSDVVAKQMALSVREKAGSDIGVGITGIAGPSGYSENQPVGTVYVAVCYKDKIECKNLMLYKKYHKLDRQMVRLLTTDCCFEMIGDIIK